MTGWVADLAVLDALASVERLENVQGRPISRANGLSTVAGRGLSRRFRMLLLCPSQTVTKRNLLRTLPTERVCYSSMAFGSIWGTALVMMLEQQGD